MSLKPIIKSAREAIDRKDYGYALQLCTDALEFEPNNYFLLVFRAVSLINIPKCDLEAALVAYTKATRAQPDNPLAYQGIINLYESKGLKPDELYHNTIENLANLHSKLGEWEKHFELKKKQLSLFKQERRTEDAIKVLDWLSSPEAGQHYKLSNEQTIEYVKHQVSLLEPFEATQITREVDSARTRISAEPVAIIRERAEIKAYEGNRLNEFYRRLGLTGKLFERLLKLCLSDFLSDESARESLANELLTLPEAGQVKQVVNEETEAVESFITGSPQSLLHDAKNDFSSGQYELVLKREPAIQESLRKWQRAFATATFDATKREWSRLKFLSTVRLGWFEDAYGLLPGISDDERLSDALFESVIAVLEQTRHFNAAVDLIENQLMRIDPETPALILRLIDLLIKLSRFDEANEYISAVKSAYDLDSDSQSAAHLYLASGMVAWLQGRRTPEACLNEFLKALKAAPESGLYFFWVGKYYWRVEKESSAAKALKCFTKALSLDPNSLSAALLLAEIILQRPALSVEGLNLIDLLQPFVAVSANARNRRLMYYFGAAHFSSQPPHYIEATTAFQAALKAPVNSPTDDDSDLPITDVHCLAFLAESFLRSGRLASAEKAFVRLQHDAPSAVSATGLAAVYIQSGHYIQAVDIFDAFDATKCSGLVKAKLLIDKFEAKFLLAKFYLSQARFKAATGQLQDCLQIEAVNHATYWRFKSQLFLLLDEFKECVECAFEPDSTEGLNSGLEELTKLALSMPSKCLASATICALRALSLSSCSDGDDLSLDWLQLAQVLLCAGVCDYAQAATQNSLKCAKSVQVAASAHHLLSKLADKQGNFCKAQHHLVRSLHLQESVSVWLDLGRLYQRHGGADLAREAFKRALAVNPESNDAAIELASLDSDATSTAAVLALAQRDFSFQPVRFDVKSALIVAAAQEDSEARQFARFLLHLRFPQQNKPSFPAPPQVAMLDSSAAEIWNLVQKEPSNLAAWMTLVKRYNFDCEYLRTRPLNDLAQAGWRGLTDPLGGGGSGGGGSEVARTVLEDRRLQQILNK